MKMHLPVHPTPQKAQKLPPEHPLVATPDKTIENNGETNVVSNEINCLASAAKINVTEINLDETNGSNNAKEESQITHENSDPTLLETPPDIPPVTDSGLPQEKPVDNSAKGLIPQNIRKIQEYRSYL